MNKVHANVGLRKLRRDRREAKASSSSQRVRAAAAGYKGPEMEKYKKSEARVQDLEQKYRMAKEGMRVAV